MQIVMKYICQKITCEIFTKKKKEAKLIRQQSGEVSISWNFHYGKGLFFIKDFLISEIVKVHIWISNHADWQLWIIIFINVGIHTT